MTESDDENISVKSFNSSSFEPDFSDVNNGNKHKQRNDYMREYMRDYRLKQKQKEEEKRHCILVRNQACDHK